jgi:excinuclease ABC subunit C
MKSSRGYVFVKIGFSKEYCGMEITEEKQDDNAYYFGPYTSFHTTENALEGLKEIYKIPCNPVSQRKQSRCLNFSLGKCMGTCEDEGVQEKYVKILSHIVEVLRGRQKDTIQAFQIKMEEASEKLDFAEAAKYRDYISSIE